MSKNRYQYKRRTHKRRTYKLRTGLNVGLVQTSNWEKRRTSTNVRPVQMSDVYIYKGKRQTLVEFEKKTIAIRNKLKITHLL